MIQRRPLSGSITSLLRATVALLLTSMMSVAAFGVAAGEVGVSITPGELAVREAVQAGQELALPTFQVGNPGDQPASYRLSATGLNAGAAQPAQPEWFTLSPATLELAPGETAEITATLKPGPEAAAGRYGAIIKSELLPQDGPVQIAAAAATRVFFDVTADPQISDTAGWQWWGILITALIAIAIGAFLLRRRTRRQRADQQEPQNANEAPKGSLVQ